MPTARWTPARAARFSYGRRRDRLCADGGHAPSTWREKLMSRPFVLVTGVASLVAGTGFFVALTLAQSGGAQGGDPFADVKREIVKRHAEAVTRLQQWIAAPSI